MRPKDRDPIAGLAIITLVVAIAACVVLCLTACTMIAGRNNTVERSDNRNVETSGTNKVSGTVIKITP